jgi:hypothetical protein
MDHTVEIFNETPDFLSALKSLNLEDEKECIEEFKSLAIKNSETSSDLVGNSSNSPKHVREEILGKILDRVAFFPLKPSVMQAELARLGLKESLSQGLAGAWADKAKKVVLARRVVKGDLVSVDFEMLLNIKTGEEGVNLQLQLHGGQEILLNFEPDELFAFYEQLEEIQNNIDKICK